MNEEPRDTSFNKCLAKACMATGSSCCCKGSIFLPLDELEKIRGWLKARPEAERANFERCIDDAHDGFALLDQENRCQFLDDRNLCRLHNEGVKPTECFWWPLHVYVNEQDQPEIRISESCCTAHDCLGCGKESLADEELAKVEAEARAIGLDVIRKFRKFYTGSYETRRLGMIEG